MKFKNTYRLFLTIFILIFSILLTSCSSLGFGTTMPTLDIQSEFENDNWLIIDNVLINKTNNKIYPLEPDTNATIEGISNVFYHGPYTYNVEFDENTFKLYTFLKTYYPDDDLVYAFFDCVFTYDYEGHEVDRTYLSELLTEEQVLSLYNTRFNKTDAFSFAVDALWKYNEDNDENNSISKQEILEHIEALYNNSKNDINTISGIAKTVGDDVWFSATISPNGHYNSGSPLLNGIRHSTVKRYNPTSKEIKIVFDYNEKNEAIIDFDENGLYTFDKDGNLKYFDIESKKSTLIHKFLGTVSYFEITNKYIGTGYEDGETGYYYFAYEKGGTIIADHLLSKYNRGYD